MIRVRVLRNGNIQYSAWNGSGVISRGQLAEWRRSFDPARGLLAMAIDRALKARGA